MAVHIAKKSDYKGIRTIWEERFTTDKKYLDVMFARLMPLCTSYIYKNESGEPLSVASFMPMKFIDSAQETVLHGWYMFGVATLRKATGRMLAAQTISYAVDDISIKNYHFIFERPANQSLNEYYFNLGFSKALKRLPIQFHPTIEQCSSGNKYSSSTLKTVSEWILKKISAKYEKKFIWENPEILQGLIELGELEEHVNNTGDSGNKETFIAINSLNGTDPERFNNTFFCFPME